MNKAIFLDRDGTINVDKKYLHKIEDFEFLPGVLDGMKMLQNAGYLLIVITNQSGIGRGYYSEKDFEILNSWMLGELESNGIHIARVYYCPHLPNAKIKKYRKVCECRKPALGMYEQAVKNYDIDLSHSWTIGDKPRDCLLCEKTECRGFLVGQDYYNEERLYYEFPLLKDKVRCVPGILECAIEILKKKNRFNN